MAVLSYFAILSWEGVTSRLVHRHNWVSSELTKSEASFDINSRPRSAHTSMGLVLMLSLPGRPQQPTNLSGTVPDGLFVRT